MDQDAYLRIADCYYMNRDYKKALSMYDKVLEYSWPASDYATFQKAMIVGINNSREKDEFAYRYQQEISNIKPDT